MKFRQATKTKVSPAAENAGKKREGQVPWHPALGVGLVLFLFIFSQLFASILISVYPVLQNIPEDQLNEWLRNSVSAQFAYILLVEGIALTAIFLFLKRYAGGFRSIGLRRPKLSDLGFGLAMVPAYYLLYLVTVGIAKLLVPGLDIEQEQDIGFENVTGQLELILAFVSLVILPPITEEIMVRGVLYSSLKKAVPIIWAALVSGALFSLAHVPGGIDGAPLYIAAVDTFVLSLVLVYLREKTGGLWACMTLHSFKNFVAFMVLFVFHAR